MLQKNEDFGCARAWYKLLFQAAPLKLQGSFLRTSRYWVPQTWECDGIIV